MTRHSRSRHPVEPVRVAAGVEVVPLAVPGYGPPPVVARSGEPAPAVYGFPPLAEHQDQPAEPEPRDQPEG